MPVFGSDTGPGLPAWTPVTAWASFTVYSVGPPASVVTYNGETYVVSTAHTSTAEFDATKWTKIAQKGLSGNDTGEDHINGDGIQAIKVGTTFPSSPTHNMLFIQRS